jgi:hypothetical protein
MDKLKAGDYLEWLKDKEEFIVWDMELSEEGRDIYRIEELEKELQTIRDIKEIVKSWLQVEDYENEDEAK